MPINWVNELYQAALEADEDFIQNLLLEIPNNQSDLREAIADLVDRYRLDLILESALEAIEGQRS
jgi:hypothetical protein